jgi:hypothetical protein
MMRVSELLYRWPPQTTCWGDPSRERLTLKDLNALKRRKRQAERELLRKLPLLSAMYGGTEREAEKQELEQLKQELELLRDRIALDIDAAEIDHKRKDRITNAAIRALRRLGDQPR